MTLVLDTRSPLLVLIADFNPAIFTPPWMAQHLYGHDEGDQITYHEFIVHNATEIRQVVFIDGVAVSVIGNRSEIFVINGDAANVKRAEEVVVRMMEILPHTPIAAIGCNLTFVDEEPGDDLIDLFKTPEGFETEGQLLSRQFGVQLQVDDHVVLNFGRQWSEQDVRFSFNYHRDETSAAAYRDFVPGIVERALDHSGNLLKSLYRYEEHSMIGFVPVATDEEVQDAAEAD